MRGVVGVHYTNAEARTVVVVVVDLAGTAGKVRQ